MNKFYKGFLIAAFAAVLFSTSCGSDGESSSASDNTIPDGYTAIYTAEELDNVRNDLTGNYFLMADLDLSSYTSWSPFGGTTTQFSGIFDGNGHTISNLTINTTDEYKGLFGYVGNEGTISNLGIVDANISSGDQTGGLAGANYGSISNCYATGTISGSSTTGGLVGSNSGTVENSYATVAVSGSSSTGGLAGLNSGTVENSYATGTVTNSGSYTGGLLGYNFGTVSSSYATGEINGSGDTGGLVGYLYSGTVSNSFYDTTTTGQTDDTGKGTPKTTAEMKTQSTFTDASWDFTDIWVIDGAINDGYPYLTSLADSY